MQHFYRKLLICCIPLVLLACRYEQKEPGKLIAGSRTPGSYSFDRNFLRQQDPKLIELEDEDARVLVSARYQAKVFTSTADIEEGKSFGWINYQAFSGRSDPHMNAYGGENRLWLGPEGGKYSLFFSEGDSMVFENWKTPAPFDTQAWQVVKKNEESVTMRKDMRIPNYAGHTLSMRVERTVRIQNKDEIESTLSVTPGDSVKFVGYSTRNLLKNTGREAWNDSTGMPCIWILDMFNPSNNATIVIPFKPGASYDQVATTDYFGKIGEDRLRFDSNVVYFKADGKKRGKIGIQPAYALPFAGSFDAKENILTITYFSIDSAGRYLNQEWNTTSEVYSGDAVNAYNDGPVGDGTQLGPFYELESVSPAAALQPGETIEHLHSVYHFTGNRKQLDEISKKLLGVDTNEIANAFR